MKLLYSNSNPTKESHMYQQTISRKFSFCSSHRLFKTVCKVEGHPCGFLHGHNYEGKVTLTVLEGHDMPMVIDFSDLKRIIAVVHDIFDHRLILNEEDPLAERLADMKITLIPGDPTVEIFTKIWAHLVYLGIYRSRFKSVLEHLEGIRIDMSETANCKGSCCLQVQNEKTPVLSQMIFSQIKLIN